MPFYISKNKLLSNKSIKKTSIIDKNIISNHINISTTNRIIGKNPSLCMNVFSSQNPYGGVGDAGVWVRNSKCWINGVSNISCFSPAQRSGANWWQRGGTLITRKHVLFAKHFGVGIITGGTPLIFVDENNNAISRKIMSYGLDNYTDIAIALLDSEVPSNIKIAKVLPTNFTNYINTNTLNGSILPNPSLYAVVLNQYEEAILKRWKGGINYGTYQLSGAYNLISTVPTSSNELQDNYYAWDKNIITGDSGNPFFLIIDNELVVTHALLTTPAEGPFITNRYDIVNGLIESLSPGEGYSLTPIDLQAVYNKYS